jgi:DNA-binding response OmpR family regulator
LKHEFASITFGERNSETGRIRPVFVYIRQEKISEKEELRKEGGTMIETNKNSITETPYVNFGVDLDAVETTKRKTILVVEDDQDTTFLIKQILCSAGFDTLSAANGEDAINKFASYHPDIVILDIMMPEMDGWETLSYLREMSDIPVIVVSALGTKDDVVKGLRKGVDDYIAKPFHNAEMVERVKAVLRRSDQPRSLSQYVFPRIHLTINIPNQEVELEDRKIKLTPKEFAVLSILAECTPRVVGYEEISKRVWNEDSPEVRKRTKYLIYLLRQKFETVRPNFEFIENIGRLGYRLNSGK